MAGIRTNPMLSAKNAGSLMMRSAQLYDRRTPIARGAAVPGLQALCRLGSPHSRVGRMKHTLSRHFGGMRNVPLPVLALVADNKSFRVNNTALRKGLESGFVRAGETIHAKKSPTTWVDLMIKSRFNSTDLRWAAVARHQVVVYQLSPLLYPHSVYGNLQDNLSVDETPSEIAHLSRESSLPDLADMLFQSVRMLGGHPMPTSRTLARLYLTEAERNGEAGAADFLRSILLRLEDPAFKTEDWAELAEQLSAAAETYDSVLLKEFAEDARFLAAAGSSSSASSD